MKNDEKWKKLYNIKTIFNITIIIILGFLILILISQNTSALKILFVDDDGEVGKPTENSGNGQGFVKSMIAYGLEDDRDFTIIDCGNSPGNPDFSGLDLDDYDILIWHGFYAMDYDRFGGKMMAQTMINDFFIKGKMVWWSGPYTGYYYFNDNFLQERWFKIDNSYSSYKNSYCYWSLSEAKIWGIENNLIDTSKIKNVMDVSSTIPNRSGYFQYLREPEPKSGAELFMKIECSYYDYYNRNGAIAYENETYGYKSILMGNFFNNIKNDTDRNKVFETVIDWFYNSRDKEGVGELISPEDDTWIQKNDKGDNDVTFKWKYKDSNLEETNQRSYYLFLSRNVDDIKKIKDELSMAKFIDDDGNPDANGNLNPDWKNRHPEKYNGFISKIYDNYNEFDENGYSISKYNLNDIEDGKYYWGVLGEEIYFPTNQSFRTFLKSSNIIPPFKIDTTPPDIVISDCAPKIEDYGKWDDNFNKVISNPYEITTKNKNEIPTDINPLKITIKDYVRYGITSGIDIERTLDSFQFDITMSRKEILYITNFTNYCREGCPDIIVFSNFDDAEKVILNWYLNEKYYSLLSGTVEFKLHFLVYDKVGNVKLPNPKGTPDDIDGNGNFTNRWIFSFSVDIDEPKIPTTPTINFFKLEDIEPNFVWLGNKNYTLSTTAPSCFLKQSIEWYDKTMSKSISGVEFGRIKKGNYDVRWNRGDKIGFVSVHEAYEKFINKKSNSPTNYSIEFRPEIDDIGYAVRVIDDSYNYAESEFLFHRNDLNLTVILDFEGPEEPIINSKITSQYIDEETGTITIKGKVKDLPKIKGVGIWKVEILVEAMNGTYLKPYPTAYLRDKIKSKIDSTKLDYDGNFEIRNIKIWPGKNKCIVRAWDFLGNLGPENDEYIIDRSRPWYGPISLRDDFRLFLLQHPKDFIWMNIELKDNALKLENWPSDAKIGTKYHKYWCLNTNIKDNFHAEIQIDYYKNAGGPDKKEEEEELKVIANIGKNGEWEIVSDDPPIDIGNHERSMIFTIDHLNPLNDSTYFAIIDPDPRGMVGDEPYAHIEIVELDHIPILVGEKLKISAKLVNIGRFTADSGSIEYPIEVCFDVRNKLTGDTFTIGTKKLEGGILKAGETGVYVEINWTVPNVGVYEITAQLDPNRTASPNNPGYSIEYTPTLEVIESLQKYDKESEKEIYTNYHLCPLIGLVCIIYILMLSLYYRIAEKKRK